VLGLVAVCLKVGGHSTTHAAITEQATADLPAAKVVEEHKRLAISVEIAECGTAACCCIAKFADI
jgi:hypothetical protein